MDPASVVGLIDQIAAGLDYAHSRGVLHRDIKPSNILFSEDRVPVIADFGLAKIREGSTSFTQAGMVVGTPEFMAPEQAMGGALDGRADVYSLGVILFRMLVGLNPFQGDTPLSVVLAHVQNPLPSPRSLNPRLSPDIEAVLVKALSKDPADRYATAGQMAAAFRAAATSAGGGSAGGLLVAPTLQLDASPTPTTDARRGLRGANRWAAFGGAAAAIAMTAIVARAVLTSGSTEPLAAGAATGAPVATTAVALLTAAPTTATEPTTPNEPGVISQEPEPEPVVVEAEPTATTAPIAAPPADLRPTQTPRPAAPPPPPVAAPPRQEPPAAAPPRAPAQAMPGGLVAPMGESGSAAAPPRVERPASTAPRPASGEVQVLPMGAASGTAP